MEEEPRKDKGVRKTIRILKKIFWVALSFVLFVMFLYVLLVVLLVLSFSLSPPELTL